MENEKYPIVWEYKGHSYSIGDTGDYDGYWEITNGKDSLITKEDYDDIEKDLQAIVDLLNSTYPNFTVDRGNEAALDAENKWLRQELEELRNAPTGPRWVRAVDFKHEVGMAYHAKDSRFKGAGIFNVDGHFKWGDGTITFQRDQGDLFILDDSPEQQSDAVELIKYIRENYKKRKDMWTDNFGIATLTDEGVYELYKQNLTRGKEGGNAKLTIDIDELWDEHSELIDDDIDSLSRWAGSTVVDKEQFKTVVAKLWDILKKG